MTAAVRESSESESLCIISRSTFFSPPSLRLGARPQFCMIIPSPLRNLREKYIRRMRILLHILLSAFTSPVNPVCEKLFSRGASESRNISLLYAVSLRSSRFILETVSSFYLYLCTSVSSGCEFSRLVQQSLSVSNNYISHNIV